MTCDDAMTICHKRQYREASWKERLGLWLHLLYCKHCSAFSRKNTRLSQLCRDAALKGLSEEEKEAMKKRLGATPPQHP